MRLDGRNVAALALLLVVGFVGMSAQWLTDAGEPGPALATSRLILVTNGDDVGVGSLRQAIFDSNLANGRARIQFQTRSITVRTPLPPLVNPAGVVIDGGKNTEIRADLSKDGPLFDVVSPHVSFSGLKLVHVGGAAILIRGGAVAVTNVEISGCGIGIQIGDQVRELIVDGSRFEGNGTGIQIASGGTVTVQKSSFARQLSAGIWAVGPADAGPGEPRLIVRDNEFVENRIGAGIINVGALLSNNGFTKSRETAVFVSGRGAVIQHNRIGSGAIGVQAEDTHGLSLVDNEIDHNASMGVLLRSSSSAMVRANRVHSNGYGIAIILGAVGNPNLIVDNVLMGQTVDGLFIVGSSPSLRNNRVMSSSAAGVRVLTYVFPQGRQVAANPSLENNTLQGNLQDGPVLGEYRVAPAKSLGP